MSWSLGESRALAVKAARGAGMSWGLAEEVGYAVYWLEGRGAPGIIALAQYLSCITQFKQPYHELSRPRLSQNQLVSSGVVCPIALGAAISDSHLLPAASILVYQPLLIVPFLAAIRGKNEATLAWSEQQVLCTNSGLTVTAKKTLLVVQAEVTLTLAPLDYISATTLLPLTTRVPDKSLPAIATLEKLAALTYAPATEASRVRGAGAGTSDND